MYIWRPVSDLINEGSTTSDFYKKKAKKALFTHFNSALSRRTKVNMILTNERKHINSRPSKSLSKVKHNEKFEKVLRTNGYPQQFIDETEVSENPIRNNNNNTDWLYSRMPYISGTIDSKLKSIFKKEGIPFRVTPGSTILKQILKQLTKPETCSRANCPIADDKVCNLKGVVYKITCVKCHHIYIGSTIRKTHDRLKEHLDTTTSSV